MKIKLENAAKLGRPGLTYNDVKKAIEILTKQKIDPTLKNIKALVKHGGSSLISMHRTKYFLEHPGKSKKSADYLTGWRDAMKAMRLFTQDNMK